jgi:hypothetical protein
MHRSRIAETQARRRNAVSQKESIWLKRIQNRLMFQEGWRAPGGRLVRKNRLYKKRLKYLARYEAALEETP